MNENGTTFRINKGDRDNNLLNSTSCLEKIFDILDMESKGINIDGEVLHHFKFADHVALITPNLKNAASKLKELQEASLKSGLKIIGPKPKY